VGYGDTYAITAGGRFFSALAVLTGLTLLAIPISIVTGNLHAEYGKMDKIQRLRAEHNAQAAALEAERAAAAATADEAAAGVPRADDAGERRGDGAGAGMDATDTAPLKLHAITGVDDGEGEVDDGKIMLSGRTGSGSSAAGARSFGSSSSILPSTPTLTRTHTAYGRAVSAAELDESASGTPRAMLTARSTAGTPAKAPGNATAGGTGLMTVPSLHMLRAPHLHAGKGPAAGIAPVRAYTDMQLGAGGVAAPAPDSPRGAAGTTAPPAATSRHAVDGAAPATPAVTRSGIIATSRFLSATEMGDAGGGGGGGGAPSLDVWSPQAASSAQVRWRGKGWGGQRVAIDCLPIPRTRSPGQTPRGASRSCDPPCRCGGWRGDGTCVILRHAPHPPLPPPPAGDSRQPPAFDVVVEAAGAAEPGARCGGCDRLCGRHGRPQQRRRRGAGGRGVGTDQVALAGSGGMCACVRDAQLRVNFKLVRGGGGWQG